MWFPFPPWVRFSAPQWGPPPKGQCRRGGRRQASRAQCESPLLLQKSHPCISSWLGGQANWFSWKDWGAVFLQFHFLNSENKYFHNEMSYDFSCSKTTAGKIHVYNPFRDVFSKNSLKFSFEGSDGWSLTTVRCFAPAEVKASNPFWREWWRGVPESSFSKTLRNIMNKTRTQFRRPPSEAVLFPNKGC